MKRKDKIIHIIVQGRGGRGKQIGRKASFILVVMASTTLKDFETTNKFMVIVNLA